MSSRTLNAICWAVLVLVAVAACTVWLPKILQPDPASLPALWRQQPTALIDPWRAIATWRWVGVRQETTRACPTVNGWKAESFSERIGLPCQGSNAQSCSPTELAAAAAQQQLLAGVGLDRICLYTAQGQQIPPFGLPDKLPDGLAAAAPDRMALAPAGEPADSLGTLGHASWEILSGTFLAQTGRTEETMRRLNATGSASTRLVFLDTHPDGNGLPEASDVVGPGRSFHGYSLAHLAHQLICGEAGSCAVEIATRLAMPYRSFDPVVPPTGEVVPDAGGGSLGLVENLAETIAAEVLEWSTDDRPDRPPHLVLNLSLGWDGELFGDLEARGPADLEPAVLAVYQALELAQKLDVLVIAAAGNQRGGPVKPTSPVFPAVWELRGPSPLPVSPLVFAVGGVDWQGLPLANARSGGKPQRVAYADHAVAATATEGTRQPTLILTGSSVATAVASSIAAAVWHLSPELRPAEVMAVLDGSGESLEARADYFPGSAEAPPLRRLSLCQALAEAPGTDLDAASCPGLEPVSPVLSRGAKATELTFLELEVRSRLSMPPCEAGRRLLIPTTGGALDVCPADRFGDLDSQRWVRPQPPNNPCMGCSLIPGDKKGVRAPEGSAPFAVLLIELGPAWVSGSDGARITSATLELDRFTEGVRNTRLTYALPGEVLTTIRSGGAHHFRFELADGLSLSRCTARLNFKVETDGGDVTSIINPVLVARQTP